MKLQQDKNLKLMGSIPPVVFLDENTKIHTTPSIHDSNDTVPMTEELSGNDSPKAFDNNQIHICPIGKALIYCNDCKKYHYRSYNCNQRFDSCCYESRRKRSLMRLKDIKIYSRRLIHISIGFKKIPNSKPSKIVKHALDKQTTKIIQKMRKQLNLKFRGVKVFDLADNGSFNHYHLAILPERNMLNGRSLNIDLVKIKKLIRKVKVNCIVKIFGFKSKDNLFSYFSKRIAGYYGHKGSSFFLSSIMSYAEYREVFSHVRSVTLLSLPKGVCSSLARSLLSDNTLCPYCKSNNLEFIKFYSLLVSGEPPPSLVDVIGQFSTDKIEFDVLGLSDYEKSYEKLFPDELVKPDFEFSGEYD